MLPHKMFFSYFNEDLKNTELGILTDARQTRRFHFNTDPGKRTALVYDRQDMDLFGDRRDNIRNLQVTHLINKAMGFRGILFNHDQGPAGTENTRDWLLNWQMTKTLAFTGNVIDKSFGDRGSQAIRNFKLEGGISPRLQLGTTFAQTVTMTDKGDKIDKTDVALNLASRVSRCTTLVATMVQAGTPEGHVGKLSRNVGIETLWAGYRLGLTYGDNYAAGAGNVTRHSYSFSSDPNGQPDPKKRHHLSGFYMIRRGDKAMPVLSRQLNFSMRLAQNTLFEMKYLQNPLENPQLLDGKIIPVYAKYYKLNQALKGNLNLIADYRVDDDYLKRTHRLQGNLGLAGKLSPRQTLEIYFGLDDQENPSGRLDAKTYKLVYDCQVDPQRYLSLSAIVRDLVNHNPAVKAPNEVEVRVDMATTF